MNKELMEKARQTRSVEELVALAKENGIELSAERAKTLFDTLNSSEELTDEELENAAGGGSYCYYDGKDRMVVTPTYMCSTHFICKNSTCGKPVASCNCGEYQCSGCKYMEYHKGANLCMRP